MRKQISLSVALGLSLLLGTAGVGLLTAQEEPVSIPDTELGLAKSSVFEVPVPPVTIDNTTDPGDMDPVGRAFAGAPPLIPHAVADLMPITREDNLCIECHVLDWRAPDKDDPTPVPVSHYVNLRGDTDEIGGKVVGARWVCVSCHLPDTETRTLVNNSFAD